MARKKRTGSEFEESTLFDLWALDDGTTGSSLDDLPDLADTPPQVSPTVVSTRAGWRALPDLGDDLARPAARPADHAQSESGDHKVVPAARVLSVVGTRAHRVQIPEQSSTGRARVQQGVRAARLLHTLEQEGRAATAEELHTLAGWPGWGATAELFDEADSRFAEERAELRALWDDRQWAQARRTVLNAHYTAGAYVRALWRAAGRLGLQGGSVLEPGCGIGAFMAAAPDGVHMTGIELDSTTAQIAHHLFPEATVKNESFADTVLRGDGFDGVVGNVPFGKIAFYDPDYNRGKHTIHNAFVLKALRMTKPGGVMVVLASRWLLDARSDGARREIADYGEFLGAVRMPNGAHQEAAGTDVIIDALVFRRWRSDDVRDADPAWVHADQEYFDAEHEPVSVNRWMMEHPDNVLGTIGVRSGQHGPELAVTAPDVSVATISRLLQDRLDAVTAVPEAKRFRIEGPVIDAPGSRRRGVGAEIVGHLDVNADGSVWAQGVDGPAPVEVPAKIVSELRILIGLRDAASGLLAAESGGVDDVVLEDLRDSLNRHYDDYVARYGPIGRFELVVRPGRGAEDEDSVRRVYPRAVRVFRTDPSYATVAALEVFDEDTQLARKADIFTKRVIGAAATVTRAESAVEALWMTLDQLGRVDLDHVATLRGITTAAARQELGTLVFDDPATSRLVPAEEYLSGNVRAKLKVARAAVASDPSLQVNIDALEPVIPEPLGPAEITVKPGASWIGSDVTRQWLEDLTGARVGSCSLDADGQWRFRMGVVARAKTDALTARGDHNQYTPKVVLGMILNGQKLEMRYTVHLAEGDRSYPDAGGTEALRVIGETVTEHFQSWLWRDQERGDALVDRYNDLFNGLRLREFSSRMRSLPGLAEGFTPRPHQMQAVNRMLFSESAGLFHEVGAGKTAEMVMGCMELRRLGMVKKPAIVVPNQLAEQFTREAKQLYPAARILTATGDDMTASGNEARNLRRLFVAKAAMGDWDIVVMTQSAFKMLGMGPAKVAYMREAIETKRAIIAEMKAADETKPVKGLEKAVVNAEEKLKRVLDFPTDPGITFEQSGIDYLCVDEAHGYKNAEVLSAVDDLGKPIGSQKAEDLQMKLWYLRSRGQSKVATLATATPIANSMVEMYVMLRYLGPQLLADAGLSSPDDWARQFTDQEIVIEQDGLGGFKPKQRTNRFRNLPELMRMWLTVGDVKTAADLDLNLPAIAPNGDGRAAAHVRAVPATAAQAAAVARLATRSKAVKDGQVDPAEDNILKIFSEGRTWAMDPRAMDPEWVPEVGETTKVAEAAAMIHRIWRETSDREYRDEFGDVSPRRGALQIVFADRSTPSDRFNVYDALRDDLTDRGVPRDEIAFIQEAKNDLQKAELFRRCRSGQVRVIVGSTEMMGTGTNIQRRAVALHHLDCPWRPADVTQREGRIIRQGNENAEAALYRWVTRGSFDGFMWETVSRKARFIEQVQSGRLDVRELDDDDPMSHGFAVVAAIAADDMRIMRKAQLEMNVQHLDRQERAFKRGVTALETRLRGLDEAIARSTTQLADSESTLADLRGRADADHTVAWTPYPPGAGRPASAVRRVFRQNLSLLEAGSVIHTVLVEALRTPAIANRTFTMTPTPLPIGQSFTVDDHHIRVEMRLAKTGLQTRLVLCSGNNAWGGSDVVGVEVSRASLENAEDPQAVDGFARAFERMINRIPAAIARLGNELADDRQTRPQIAAQAALPWPRAEERDKATAELAELIAEMTIVEDSEVETAVPSGQTPQHPRRPRGVPEPVRSLTTVGDSSITL